MGILEATGPTLKHPMERNPPAASQISHPGPPLRVQSLTRPWAQREQHFKTTDSHRPREGEDLAQGHTAGLRQSRKRSFLIRRKVSILWIVGRG